MSEWISVKDRLPEDVDCKNRDFAIWVDDGGELIGSFVADFVDGQFVDYWHLNEHEHSKHITHWLELPDCPSRKS